MDKNIKKQVNAMSDDKVCDMINFDYGIKMYDVDRAMISHQIYLPKCKWAKYHTKDMLLSDGTCRGHWYMPQMRDLLISLMST